MGARRAWGLATQLYSVRSEGSWGFGDPADLGDLKLGRRPARPDYVLTTRCMRHPHQAHGAPPAHLAPLRQSALPAR